MSPVRNLTSPSVLLSRPQTRRWSPLPSEPAQPCPPRRALRKSGPFRAAGGSPRRPRAWGFTPSALCSERAPHPLGPANSLGFLVPLGSPKSQESPADGPGCVVFCPSQFPHPRGSAWPSARETQSPGSHPWLHSGISWGVRRAPGARAPPRPVKASCRGRGTSVGALPGLSG